MIFLVKTKIKEKKKLRHEELGSSKKATQSPFLWSEKATCHYIEKAITVKAGQAYPPRFY